MSSRNGRERSPNPRYPKRRRVICIATEGKNDEPEYFSHLQSLLKDYHFNIKSCDHKSDVSHVLKRIESLIKTSDACDYWAIFDTDEQIDQIKKYLPQFEEKNIKAGISNPCFEVWLLNHFTNSTKHFRDSQECKKTWKSLNKSVSMITLLEIDTAIRNCQNHTLPIPDESQTTIHSLVQSILTQRSS